MHELFTKVLSNRDLSKAGDLFSISDSEILNDLCEVLSEIEQIISLPDYLENNNDQSVVEICITRILSCIRETKTAVTYCSALVKLLESCLQYNLQPIGTNHEDPPHAKISTDIISSIFLNYDKKEVMRIALPVAVKFLGKGNKELSINLASYLSLAAIDYAYLLSPYIDPILTSILAGNYGLCRILPQIYEVAPDELVPHTTVLVRLFSRCDLQAKLALLQLFTLIAQEKPSVLEPHVDQFCEFLVDPLTVSAVMTVLLRLVEHRPNLIVEHINKIKSIANADTSKVLLSAQILAAAGKISKDKAQCALDFILEYLPHLDRTSQTILLQETTKLCSSYPVLFTDKVLACVRQKNVLSKPQSFSQPVNESEKTSGGVTVVKLNSPVVSSALGSMTPTITSLRSIPIPNQNNYVMTANVGNINGRNNVVTIHTSGMTSTSLNTNYNNTGVVNAGTVVVPPTPPHMGYTRRVKLGDSRSTGKLHPANATLRSGSAGGLYKSMTRLSSSQQISQNGSSFMSANNFNIPIGPTTYVTSTNPLGGDVVITGPNKWSVPLTKITSGGVTVTTSPTKIRPYSQGPSSLMESTSVLGKFSSDVLSQSSNSIIMQQNSIPVDQCSSASPFLNTTIQKSVMTLPINSSTTQNDNYEVVISGPMIITSLDANNSDNRSVTLLNTNNSIINQRMSTFEPYQIMRDPVQQFCEKNFQSIKTYMDQVSQHLPPPIRCGIEEKRTKKVAKLHFACQVRGPHCLYSKTCFTMRTRNPKIWIHLMFLDFQVRNYVKEKCVLSTREAGISNLKNIWQILKCESKTFTELVTSHFPSEKEQEILINELRHSGFLDVFEVIKTDLLKSSGSELEYQWGCFLCNHPDKAVGFLQSNNQPVIEGQLKEKKGKWRLFRRWRTRYFTLSGAHLSCKGSRGGESIDVNQIRSVKVSRGARNIPKAFEIFTGDQTLILKPKDGKNAEEWVQCLSIVVAHSQARDNLTVKTNSLPARGIINNRSTF